MTPNPLADPRRVRDHTFEWNHDYQRAFRNLGIRPAQLTFTDLEVDDQHKMNAILTVDLSGQAVTGGNAVRRGTPPRLR